MKSVVLVGMIKPVYKGDITEIWGINRAHEQQEGLTRIYFFDDERHFGKDFVDNVNKYDVHVVTRQKHEEIHKSDCYPLDDVMEFFGMEMPYFTCTAAYMLAQAISEGYDHIVLHGMYHIADSLEYMHHKPCVEYWVGQARGRGINVEMAKDCALGKPLSWQSPLYGYIRQLTEWLCISTLAASYRACMAYPIKWVNAEEDDQPIQEKIDINNVLLTHSRGEAPTHAGV